MGKVVLYVGGRLDFGQQHLSLDLNVNPCEELVLREGKGLKAIHSNRL